MDKETQQKIQERYAKLPADIKQAIDANKLAEKVSAIAKKNRILVDQTSDLYTEVFLSMLGIEPLADFAKNVATNVRVPMATAIIIAQDVNKEIFLPIRRSLQEIQTADTDETSEEIPNPERDEIIHDIENPLPTPETKVAPITDPSREIESRSATDSFVANKVVGPSISSAETTIAKTQPQNTEKKYVADPYREPIN